MRIDFYRNRSWAKKESIDNNYVAVWYTPKITNIRVVEQYIDKAFSAKTDALLDFYRKIMNNNKKQFDIVLCESYTALHTTTMTA